MSCKGSYYSPETCKVVKIFRTMGTFTGSAFPKGGKEEDSYPTRY